MSPVLVTFDSIRAWCAEHGVDAAEVVEASIVFDAANGGSGRGIVPMVELTVRVPLRAFPAVAEATGPPPARLPADTP